MKINMTLTLTYVHSCFRFFFLDLGVWIQDSHREEIYVQKKKHIRFSDLYIDNVFSEGTDSHRDENMYNRYPAGDNTYQHMRWHL